MATLTLSRELRHFVGKKIVKIILNPTYDDDSKSWMYDPRIYFDDGSELAFVAQEGQGGYGVQPVPIVRR